MSETLLTKEALDVVEGVMDQMNRFRNVKSKFRKLHDFIAGQSQYDPNKVMTNPLDPYAQLSSPMREYQQQYYPEFREES